MRASLLLGLFGGAIVPIGACHTQLAPEPELQLLTTVAAALGVALPPPPCDGPVPMEEPQARGPTPHRVCSSGPPGPRLVTIVDATDRPIFLTYSGETVRYDSAGKAAIDSLRFRLEARLGVGQPCGLFRWRWARQNEVASLETEATSDVVRGPDRDWFRIVVSVGWDPKPRPC